MPPRRLVAAAAALFAVAGCATETMRRTTAPQPTLAQTIDAQIAKQEALVWGPRRLLTWADFKGKPPDNAGVVAAETAYTIVDGVRCVGTKFEYRVVAAFRTRDSWVRHSVLRTPADSARALRHEQTHFDLSEVHARRLRRYFSELMAPCRMSSGDWSAAASRMERDEKAAQAQYDSETDHGRNAAQQVRWDKEVDSQLVSLAKFIR
jgi:hypothetical protein